MKDRVKKPIQIIDVDSCSLTVDEPERSGTMAMNILLGGLRIGAGILYQPPGDREIEKKHEDDGLKQDGKASTRPTISSQNIPSFYFRSFHHRVVAVDDLNCVTGFGMRSQSFFNKRNISTKSLLKNDIEILKDTDLLNDVDAMRNIIDIVKDKKIFTEDKVVKIKAKVANGGDINAIDSIHFTALHWAAYSDEPELVKALITLGANVNAIAGHRGETPLINASCSRNKNTAEIIDILCQNGADVNYNHREGTALHGAVDSKYGCFSAEWARKPEIVQALIRNHANVNVISDSRTAISLLFGGFHFSPMNDIEINLIKTLLENRADLFKSEYPFRFHSASDHIPDIVNAINLISPLESRTKIIESLIAQCNEVTDNNKIKFKNELSYNLSILLVKSQSEIKCTGGINAILNAASVHPPGGIKVTDSSLNIVTLPDKLATEDYVVITIEDKQADSHESNNNPATRSGCSIM